ncbi:MAG: hypothetical protein EOP19_30720 [Hyphomicrobiales bacterium]|nr:MAG: hypothetical protein EOP19_30720 [Hyphomicrobiales bacterium]
MIAAVLSAGAAKAQSYPEKTVLSPYDEAVFFFGGRFHKDWFGDGFMPWTVDWDDTYLVGAGYQRTLLDYKDIRLGAEVGIAGRFAADGSSAELWAALYGRYDGFVFGNVRVSPLFSLGLSYATGTQGYEADRMAAWGKNEPFLIYLGPEIALSLVDQPQWEAFTRFHHRSGGFGLIADLDASNVITAGVRYKF